jgi:sec-independent protein translocase protein TatC
MSEQTESFISHLIELRQRLVRAVAAILVFFVALFFWPGPGYIYDLLAAPLLAVMPANSKMIATGVITPFMVPVKVTALGAFMIALPYVLYQAWAFVAPGLYENEKKLAVPLIIGSTVLFLCGVAFCYFIVFGTVFAFIQGFSPASVSPMPDIDAYFNFVITMFLSFGITFEIPIVVILLVRMGVVSLEKLKEARPYVIVGAFVVAAVVTPPDVLSQFMLAVPMCVLYEAGLFLARFVGTRKEEAKEATKEESRPAT